MYLGKNERSEDLIMKKLVVREINQSIKLMDEFISGDYDYLELENWFQIYKHRGTSISDRRSTDFCYVSLLISRTRNIRCELSDDSPTMTELRKKQYYPIYLDKKYSDGSIYEIIRRTSTTWKKDIVIKLPIQICLRAQTSMNRTDYGCEWIGGGDWVEKTLYGDTTDFYISAIILKTPPKTMLEQSEEVLKQIKSKKEENDNLIMEILDPYIKKGTQISHEVFGNGIIESITGESFSVRFVKTRKTFSFKIRGGLLKGNIRITDMNKKTTEKINLLIIENQANIADIENLSKAIETDNILGMYYTTKNYYERINNQK